MKKLSYLIVLALILGLVFTGCSSLSNISQVPATEQSGVNYLTKGTEAEPAEFDLYAGQNMLVGKVLVWDDGTNLCLKYELSAEALADGWRLTETHWAVATDPNGIPQNNGNPTPGQFLYGDDNLRGVEFYQECIPFAEIGSGVECDDDLIIAAHAVVCKLSDDVWTECETAWGGDEDFPGANWATYFEYTIQCEIVPIEEPEICLGAGGGKTIGFWSNKNGQKILTDNWSAIQDSDVLSDLILAGLPNTNLTAPYLTSPGKVKDFLLKATAVVMRYMLAAQWLGMQFNVLVGDVDGESLVYLGDLNEDGIYDIEEFMSVDDVLDEVSSEWNGWNRTTQEYWKNILDDANNNLIFLVECP